MSLSHSVFSQILQHKVFCSRYILIAIKTRQHGSLVVCTVLSHLKGSWLGSLAPAPAWSKCGFSLCTPPSSSSTPFTKRDGMDWHTESDIDNDGIKIKVAPKRLQYWCKIKYTY